MCEKTCCPFKIEFSHLYLQIVINIDKSEMDYINILQQAVGGLGNEYVFACNYSSGCLQYKELPVKASSWQAVELGIASGFIPL